MFRAACINVLKDQVKMEFEASLQYLLMAAFFTQVRKKRSNP
jgi:ferritin